MGFVFSVFTASHCKLGRLFTNDLKIIEKLQNYIVNIVETLPSTRVDLRSPGYQEKVLSIMLERDHRLVKILTEVYSAIRYIRSLQVLHGYPKT